MIKTYETEHILNKWIADSNNNVSKEDEMTQTEIFRKVIELTNLLTDVELLKVISDNALENINAIRTKEKILVDDTETYKFDDTMRYDD